MSQILVAELELRHCRRCSFDSLGNGTRVSGARPLGLIGRMFYKTIVFERRSVTLFPRLDSLILAFQSLWDPFYDVAVSKWT